MACLRTPRAQPSRSGSPTLDPTKDLRGGERHMTTTTATRPRDALARVQPFHDLTVARARGSWYVDTEGHRYLDMLSGCWCSILGHNRRRRWAELLRMVFQVEVEVCARCGGEARIIGVVTEAQGVR